MKTLLVWSKKFLHLQNYPVAFSSSSPLIKKIEIEMIRKKEIDKRKTSRKRLGKLLQFCQNWTNLTKTGRFERRHKLSRLGNESFGLYCSFHFETQPSRRQHDFFKKNVKYGTLHTSRLGSRNEPWGLYCSVMYLCSLSSEQNILLEQLLQL